MKTRDSVVCVALSVGIGALLMVPRYLPMTDLPQHEFMVSALRGVGDPVRFPNDLYARNLGHANQLFHALGWALSAVMPVDRACQLLVALSVALVLLAIQRAATAAGRTPWVGLLAGPLAVAMMFRWGLVGNLLGFGLYLAALPALERHVARPTWRSVVGQSAVALGLYAVHNSTPFYFGVTLAAWSLLYVGGAPRALFSRMAPLLPLVTVLALGYLRFRSGMSRDVIRLTSLDSRWILRWVDLPRNFLSLSDLRSALLVLGLAALACLLLRASAPASAATDEPALRDGAAPPLWERRYMLLAAVMFAQYAVWPYGISGSGLLYHRFLPPAFAALLIALAPRADAPLSVVARLAVLAVPASVFFAHADALLTCHRGYADLDAVIASVAPGSAVVSLNFTEPPGTRSIFNHAQAHVTALRGGRSVGLMAILPHMPVVFRPGTERARQSERLTFDRERFAPSDDLRQFRYVLVRVPEPRMIGALSWAMGASARLRVVSGQWALFESTLRVAPLTAPDPPPPRGPTLDEIFRGASAAGR